MIVKIKILTQVLIYKRGINMKKRNYLLIVGFFILMLLFTPKVDAVLCTSKKYTTLKSEAYRVTLTYELKFDSKHQHYFEVTAMNVGKNVMVKRNGYYIEPTKDNDTFVVAYRVDGGKEFEVNIYGGYDTACPEEFLYTKKITLPKYNKYSEREECIEYEEFNLCNKWYSGYIGSDKEFDDALAQYIKSITKEEPNNIPEKEQSFFEKIIDFYTSNLIITLPITIFIVLLIVFIVVRKVIRRKNRIKLN